MDLKLFTEVYGMSFSDTKTWANEMFGKCELGDKRQTDRLLRMAQRAAENPSASFPGQMETWGDLKAAYRLFDSPHVTFYEGCDTVLRKDASSCSRTNTGLL